MAAREEAGQRRVVPGLFGRTALLVLLETK